MVGAGGYLLEYYINTFIHSFTHIFIHSKRVLFTGTV